MARSFLLAGLVLLTAAVANTLGATLHVPRDFKTIQAALDAAKPGDTVLVEPGTYREQVRLKERVTLKSAGDDAPAKLGLKRADATIIEHAGANAKGPAVLMAEGSVLDGFRVTRAGAFDQKEYDLHYATSGELLPDERGAVGVKGAVPALVLPGVTATVQFCIVHDNGQAGIGCSGKGNHSRIYKNIVYRNMGGGIGSADGASPTIEANVCFNNLRGGIGNRNSKAVILNNESFDNVRAGIGIREGATPIVRGNKCYNNRRAGIGVRMAGTNPIIEDNDCFGNEMAGIGSRDGAAPIIRNNRCYKNQMAGIGSRDGAKGIIESNNCYENEMAGIGSRNGAAPTIRFNKCHKNKMAGIGARDGARPIIEGNECYENEMAGIGARDGAEPTIRGNKCYRNDMAGIGSRLGAKALILDNDCYENKLAGIGAREGAMPIIKGNRCIKNDLAGIGTRDRAFALLEGNECRLNKAAGIGARSGAVVMLLHNKCIDNNLVALGLRHGAIAFVMDNEFVRAGGMPPIIAVREGSQALIAGNTIKGGGVAGILVDGVARIRGNRFEGGGKSGSAVWGWNQADLTVIGNNVDGYRNLLNASGCKVAVNDNLIRNFQGTAITIKNPIGQAIVHGNIARSKNPKDRVLAFDGPAGKPKDNVIQEPDGKDELRTADERFWANVKKQAKIALPERTGTQTIEEGSWKLVVEHGKTTTYKLYHLKGDPQKDLAGQLDNHVLRLRGRLERQEAVEYKAMMRKEGAGK
ncbi:MAG: right-handed parallel beta-helix repeat-containing protein [Planctomycetes bacterium]|nr:right-handed parallel beta-helix repeat-containing protein [Planctomycetota bacterium]